MSNGLRSSRAAWRGLAEVSSSSASHALVELFVLLPAPHDRLVVRLASDATIAQVKQRIWSQRGIAVGGQHLMLPGGAEARDAATLASCGLDSDPLPTLTLKLPADFALSQAGGLLKSAFQSAQAAVLAPAEELAEDRAALRLQRIARARGAKHELRWRVRALRLRILCADSELRSARLVQSLWRARKLREHAERLLLQQRAVRDAHESAIIVIQRAARRRQARAAAAAAIDARREPPPSCDVSGMPASLVVHKETGYRSLGRWQFVTWRRRYVFATAEALCYSRAGEGSSHAGGATTTIPYSSIICVGIQADDDLVLVLQTSERHFTFRFPTPPHAEQWAAALCAASAQARTLEQWRAADSLGGETE